MSNQSEWDPIMVTTAVLAFSLPLTLLIPDFSIWDVVPKFRITRCHVLSQEVSWFKLNIIIGILLVIMFCACLEIRKRRLDILVEDVLAASRATNSTLENQTSRQTAAVKACVRLLDASTNHYEHITLFRDELRRRDKIHHPPEIEPSSIMTLTEIN